MAISARNPFPLPPRGMWYNHLTMKMEPLMTKMNHNTNPLPSPTPPFNHAKPLYNPGGGGGGTIPRAIRIALESPTEGLETLFTMQAGFDAIIVKPEMEILPEVDAVCFSGGADINPALYKQKGIPGTVWSGKRDTFSLRLHKEYALLPKVGVCRGAQFLCAINGGSLWQNIKSGGHNSSHFINTVDGYRSIYVTSVHHQACRPSKLMHLLAWSDKKATCVEDDKTVDTTGHSIAEAFFIPDDNALCVQFHPEYGMKSCEDYFWELFWQHFPMLKNLPSKKRVM